MLLPDIGCLCKGCLLYTSFGQKSFDNLVSAIEKSKISPLENFINALGINQVGLANAKLLCRHFDNNINHIAVSYTHLTAIMTTDTVQKEAAVSFEINGVECKLGGIAKGSGMIHPNMATMLVFITTDVAISSDMLQKALSEDVKTSFNMISVDGDTSTNDMVSVLANGMAGNKEITEECDEFEIFKKALNTVTVNLCRKIAGDGEGCLLYTSF